ncbi:MAG TPA: acyltransferase [Vicinamibacterales bacterium]|nr:acyltransferase [Vicinamibacterales bacterium]
MAALVRLFRRETSSTEFIPVIDGLRFLAISMVVFYHVSGYIFDKSKALASASSVDPSANIFAFGHQGVQLFFVISGFILAMPFMRPSFGLTATRIPLAHYFWRRVTRLEPPYVLSTLVLFVLLTTVVATHRPGSLGAPLLASLLYVNNLVYPGEFPRINAVTWSLEIEIQFYLLAPFLVWGVCALKNTVARRAMVLLLITLAAIVSWGLETVWHVQALTLVHYAQYFLAGILLCDVYLLDLPRLRRLDRMPVAVAGVLLLLLITGVEHSQTPHLALKILSPFLILGFYLIVFGNRVWHRLFSLNVLTLIGGMCYTIYLWHYAVISAVGRLTVARLAVPNFYLHFAIQAALYVVAVLLVSSVFYLLIEKPCMKRDWPMRLVGRVRHRFVNGRPTKNTAPQSTR